MERFPLETYRTVPQIADSTTTVRQTAAATRTSTEQNLLVCVLYATISAIKLHQAMCFSTVLVYYRLQPSCRKSRFSMKDTTRSTRMQLEQKVDGKVGIRIVIAIQAKDSLLFKDYDS